MNIPWKIFTNVTSEPSEQSLRGLLQTESRHLPPGWIQLKQTWTNKYSKILKIVCDCQEFIAGSGIYLIGHKVHYSNPLLVGNCKIWSVWNSQPRRRPCQLTNKNCSKFSMRIIICISLGFSASHNLISISLDILLVVPSIISLIYSMQTDTLNNRYNIAFITLKTKHIFHKVTSKTFDLIYFYHNSKVISILDN